MFEYWTVTTLPSLNASVVAITEGFRGPMIESAKATWTAGNDNSINGPRTSKTSAIALVFPVRVCIFSSNEQSIRDS